MSVLCNGIARNLCRAAGLPLCNDDIRLVVTDIRL